MVRDLCFFALAARTRPVYLLPIFPAIALLAARALNALIAHGAASVRTGQAPVGSFSSDAAPRFSSLARWFVVGVLISDITVALATYFNLQYDKRAQARFEFVRQIGVAIAANTSLFATPDLDREDFIVLAYRLRRQIDQKPIYCAKRNDYFLTIKVNRAKLWRCRMPTLTSFCFRGSFVSYCTPFTILPSSAK